MCDEMEQDYISNLLSFLFFCNSNLLCLCLFSFHKSEPELKSKKIGLLVKKGGQRKLLKFSWVILVRCVKRARSTKSFVSKQLESLGFPKLKLLENLADPHPRSGVNNK